MTFSRFATARLSSSFSVAATTRRLSGGVATTGPSCQRVPSASVDVDEALLETASRVLAHVCVLRSLTASAAAARMLVVEIHDTAERHGIASGGAIGVTGALVDLLCQPCEREIARTLGRARHIFSDRELLDGAASMLAATSWHLAQLLDLDPLVVVDEAVRDMAPVETRRRAVMRRSDCRRHHALL